MEKMSRGRYWLVAAAVSTALAEANMAFFCATGAIAEARHDCLEAVGAMALFMPLMTGLAILRAPPDSGDFEKWPRTPIIWALLYGGITALAFDLVVLEIG